MATLAQIKAKVRLDISQSDTTTSDFTDDQLTGFINEGNRYVGKLVRKPTDHIEIQAEDDKEGYTLPTDAILLVDAYFGDKDTANDLVPIEILTEEALKFIAPNWMDKTSTSKGRPRRIFLLDAQTVVVWPRPDTASSATGKKLVLNYCYEPAVMSVDSDIPETPIIFHDLISKYAVHLCYLGKLNKPDVGLGILGSLETMAKKIENLVNKEQLNTGFSWGTRVGDDGDFSLLNQYFNGF